MLRKVEISAAVNALNLLEAERHLELDVGGCVGIMGKLLVVVEAVFLVSHTQSFVPLQAALFPHLKPLELLTGTNKELHLHLLKFTHAEHKLASHNLVAECLANLSDTERQTHATGLLNIEEVHKDALSGLGTQIHVHGVVAAAAHLGLEHEVKLAHVGPVAGAADGVDNLIVEDDLLELLEVVVVHSLLKTAVQLVPLGLVGKNAWVGLAEHRLVEAVAKAFLGFSHLFVHLFLKLGKLVLDEHIGTVTFLAVAVVDQGVVESIDVATGLPDGWVHEHRRVDSHDILVQQRHGFPPIALDVVFQLHTVLSVVIDCAQAVVNLT